MRNFTAITAVLLSLAGLAFALIGAGVQFISDCSQPITGKLAMIFTGLVIFVLFSTFSVRQKPRAAYFVICGTALLVLGFDWHQQHALADVLRSSCASLKIR